MIIIKKNKKFAVKKNRNFCFLRMSFLKSRIGQLCSKITNDIFDNKVSLYFREPVASQEYKNLIKNPMDLGTIKKKIKSNQYTGFDGWKHDMDLIYSNAVEFNGEDSEIAGIALYLKKKTDKMIKYLDLYNKQNFEEYTRAYYRELRDLISKRYSIDSENTGPAFPVYTFRDMDQKFTKLDDMSTIEEIINLSTDSEKSKSVKREVNLDNLKRPVLDKIWLLLDQE